MILKKNQSLSPNLFTCCREEEKMRLTLTLVQELNSNPNYPHIIIWFDAIEENRLVYSLLVVRKESEKTIDRMLEKVDPNLEFIPNRTQLYREVEVNDFTLKMKIKPEDLSSDFSIHPTKARQRIVRILEKGLGILRDYYGGLLQKKEENLLKLKRNFPKISEKWIEDVFFSIEPQKMQAILPEKTLRDFFSYSLCSIKNNISHNSHGFFAYCKSNRKTILDDLKREFYQKKIDLHSIVCS